MQPARRAPIGHGEFRLLRAKRVRVKIDMQWSTGAIGSLLTLVFCVSRGAAQAPAPADTVDRFIRAELARQRIPGMSVAVLRGDSVLL